MAEKDWPPKEEFADRLARLRRHKGLENKAIAQATGVKPKTVSMWAAGQEPKGAALLALAELFSVTPDYLLHGKESRVVNPPARKSGFPIEEDAEKSTRRKKRTGA